MSLQDKSTHNVVTLDNFESQFNILRLWISIKLFMAEEAGNGKYLVERVIFKTGHRELACLAGSKNL